MEDPWLKVADAARYLGLSPSTLIRYADAGDITHIRTRTGYRRFKQSDLDAYIQESRVQSRKSQAPTPRTSGVG